MSVISDIKEVIADRELMESFSHKTVLITGASGLIGSMLIKTLYYANEEYGLDLRLYGHARNIEKVKAALGNIINDVSIICSDDFNISVTCDYIIHTASPTSSKYFVEHPVETIDTILAGTKAMLELAKTNRATLVYLSSMEEYGVPYIAGEIMTEDKVGVIDHLTARSCYPEGKRMCECMCAAYVAEYNVPVKIARLAQTFGAGIPLSDNRVSMQFAKSVIENKNIILHTEGKSVSNYCYLSDAISGILTVAIKGNNGDAYNICNDKETRTIFEIASLVCKEIAGGAIRVMKDIPEGINFGFAPDNTMRLSSKKLMQLGWGPKVDMTEGYNRLISYLKKQRMRLDE